MKRLASLLASVFVAWHATVLIIAPAPPSQILTPIHEAIRFYSRGLHLDSAWRLFVQVSWGGKVDYIVNGKNEKKLAQASIVPNGLWLSSAYVDYFYLQYEVYNSDRSPDVLKDLAKFYCRCNAQLSPESISFLIHYQQKVSPEAFVSSMDPHFVEDTLLDPVTCHPESDA